jgi:hypothetical protein
MDSTNVTSYGWPHQKNTKYFGFFCRYQILRPFRYFSPHKMFFGIWFQRVFYKILMKIENENIWKPWTLLKKILTSKLYLQKCVNDKEKLEQHPGIFINFDWMKIKCSSNWYAQYLYKNQNKPLFFQPAKNEFNYGNTLNVWKYFRFMLYQVFPDVFEMLLE